MNWQGWTADSGMTQVEYFNEYEISRRCVIPCENCGFSYLNSEGGMLNIKDGKFLEDDVPLCGVW